MKHGETTLLWTASDTPTLRDLFEFFGNIWGPALDRALDLARELPGLVMNWVLDLPPSLVLYGIVGVPFCLFALLIAYFVAHDFLRGLRGIPLGLRWARRARNLAAISVSTTALVGRSTNPMGRMCGVWN